MLKELTLLGICVVLFSTAGADKFQNIPDVSEGYLETILLEQFSHPRNYHNQEFQAKLVSVRSFITNTFTILANDKNEIEFETDEFPIEISSYGNVTGINYYLTFKGTSHGTKDDKIIALCSHYESNDVTNGTDNNGSGMTAMIEIAKILSRLPYRSKYTILLVANDFEEKGNYGIKHFINGYLEKTIMKSGGPEAPTFQGAFLFETMMDWNDTDNSQHVPIPDAVFEFLFPDLYKMWIENNRRGDFLLPMGRAETDKILYSKLVETWNADILPDPIKYKCYSLPMPIEGVIPNPPPPEIRPMLRADYKEFYYYNGTAGPLKAVMITDSGDNRGIMRECYGKPCDDSSTITPEKMTFLKKITKTTLHVLLDLAEYQGLITTTPVPPTTTTTSSADHQSKLSAYLLITSVALAGKMMFMK